MEIQPFTKDARSLSPIVAEQVPWFKGKDVATSLEYTNPAKALRDHVDEEDKKSFLELLQSKNETFTPFEPAASRDVHQRIGLLLARSAVQAARCKILQTLGHARSFAFDQEAWTLRRTRLDKPR